MPIAPTNDDSGSDIFLGGFLLNFTYFEKRVKDLKGFEGFSPRYTLIGKLRPMPNETDPNGTLSVNTSTIFSAIVIYSR